MSTEPVNDAFDACHLIDRLAHWAETHDAKDKRALLFLDDKGKPKEQFTYGKLWAEIKALASRLLAPKKSGGIGIEAGQAALLVYPPGLDFVVAFCACLLAGIVAVPVYPPNPSRLKDVQAFNLIKADCGADVALTTAKLNQARLLAKVSMQWKVSKGSAELLKLMWVATDSASRKALLIAKTAALEGRPYLKDSSTAFLQYTSGSTGDPKGVIISHGNLRHNIEYLARSLGATPASCGVVWLPLYHDAGLNGVLCMLQRGAHVINLSPVSFIKNPPIWLEQVARHRATHTIAPNFACALVARKWPRGKTVDLTSVKNIMNGAEPIQPKVVAAFLELFGPMGLARAAMRPGYGLAEHVVFACQSTSYRTLHVARSELEVNSIVRTMPPSDPDCIEIVGCGSLTCSAKCSVELAIVDKDSRDRLNDGCVGEIWVASPSRSAGYFGHPELSSIRLNAKLAGSERRWLRTGDSGFVVDGELFVCGRIKDLIIVRGRNLYPQDIEHTVEDADARVRPGCVAAFAAPRTDAFLDEQVAVVAELRTREAKDGELHALCQKLYNAVIQERSVAPSTIVLIPPRTIPKTTSGKISRAKTKQVLSDSKLDIVYAFSVDHAGEADRVTEQVEPPSAVVDLAPALEQHLLLWLQAELEMPELTLDSSLAEAGLDSVTALATQGYLEREYGARLSTEDLFRPDLTVRMVHQLACDDRGSESADAKSEDPMAQSYPLSSAQQRMIKAQALAPMLGIYNILVKLSLAPDVEERRLLESLRGLIRRHDALSTRYGHATTGIVDPGLADSFELESMESLESMQACAARAIELDGSRCAIRGHWHAASRTLLLVFHHVAADGASMSILLKDLEILYLHSSADEVGTLDQAPSFAKAAQALHAAAVSSDGIGFWANGLKMVPPALAAPNDGGRSSAHEHQGSVLRATLPSALAAAVSRLSCSDMDVFFVAYELLLGIFGGQTDVVVGMPEMGRISAHDFGTVGMFVNTVAVRLGTQHHSTETFASRIAMAHRFRQKARDYLTVPFESVLDVLETRQPFQAWFNYLGGAVELAYNGDADAGLLVRSANAVLDTGLAKFDIALDVGADGELVLYTRDCLWSSACTEQFLSAYIHLLGVVTSPGGSSRPLAELDWLSQKDLAWQQRLLRGPQTEWPTWPLMHQFFERSADRTPQAVALALPDGSEWTYGKLDAEANRIANWLVHSAGVAVKDCVGILLPRGFLQIAALLGVLKAGAAYVPMDLNYPRSRMDAIVEDASINICLGNALTKSLLPCAVNVEAMSCHAATGRPANVSVGLDDLAYILYTSGSTGQPKGVEIEHRSVSNFGNYMASDYPHLDVDRVLLIPRISWDGSVNTIVFTFARGAVLCLVPQDVAGKLPEKIEGLVRGMNITRYIAPPGLLACMDPSASPIRHIISGGDVLTPSLLQAWAKVATIHNVYGPTETTVYVSHTIGLEDDCLVDGSVTIGKALHNVQLHVLDEHLRPLPVGSPGELFIGGKTLGRGYRGMPELTAAKYVERASGERLYRTGDLVRCLRDGQLVFLGRISGYVKVRGYRVELGEIAAVLVGHPRVRRAEAVVFESKEAIVAFVEGSAEVASLLALCRSKLVDYMVPTHIFVLESMPLDPVNGKVNRKALLAMLPELVLDYGARRQEDKFVAPRTQLERQLCEVFQEVLGVAHVGIDDNFFKLGGHSLLVVRALTLVHERIGRQITVKDVFKLPTVRLLAVRVEESADNSFSLGPFSSPLHVRDSSAPAPLSFAQERMLFIERFNASGSGTAGGAAQSSYIIPMCVKLSVDADLVALDSALETTVWRHRVLNSVYVDMADGSGAHQVFLQPPPFAVCVVDSSEVESKLITGFNLDTEIPIRAFRFKVDCRWHLAIVFHHIALDGVSMQILLAEVAKVYTSIIQEGRVPSQPDLKLQYEDYAAWERANASSWMAPGLEFWKEQLEDYQQLELSWDYPRPPVVQHDGDTVPLEIPADVAEKLRDLAKRLNTTMFAVLLSVFYAVLHKLSGGQEDLVVGAPFANRPSSQTQAMIGMFVNTLPLRARLEDGVLFEDFVRQVSSIAAAAAEWQHIPFERIVDEIKEPRDTSRHPVYQVMFSVQSFAGSSLAEVDGLPLEAASGLDFGFVPAKFDLDMVLDDSRRSIAGNLTFSTSLFDRSTVERMAGYFVHAATIAVSESKITVDGIEIQSSLEMEAQLALLRGPTVERDDSQWLLMHQIFEQSADKAPDAVALMMMEEAMSYREVEARANQLCHYLVQEHGIQVEDRVGVLFPRGFDQIIAMLAILKAGAAYVPLDTMYPTSRLETIALDSRMKVCLASSCVETASGLECAVALEDVAKAVSRHQSSRPAQSRATLDNLAYVLFTSGSTGRPKGVEVEHRSVSNFAWHLNGSSTGCCSEHVLQAPRLSWDVSVANILLAFNGANMLCIVPPQLAVDLGGNIADIINAMSVTRVVLAPSLLDCINPTQVPTLRHVLSAGDRLRNHTVTEWSRCGILVDNMYGPTECTVAVTSTERSQTTLFARGEAPIGVAICNTQLHVLDAKGRMQPRGVPGELYIGGTSLARGYNDPAMTSEVFFYHNSERVYKTGDIVRLATDGQLEFIGRAGGGYTKVRGYRVELGEIAAVVSEHPGVTRAEAVVFESKEAIVAFAEGSIDGSAKVSDLLALCRSKLVDYMVPAHIFVLESMPLDANGKVDRKALLTMLPELILDSVAFGRVDELVAPRTQLEWQLCEVFQEVLGVAHVGIDDNFFELGGNSLLASRLVSRLRVELGQKVSLRDVFQFSTVRGLAAVLRQEKPGTVFEALASDAQEMPGAPTCERHRWRDLLTRLTGFLAAACLVGGCFMPLVFAIHWANSAELWPTRYGRIVLGTLGSVLLILVTALALRWLVVRPLLPMGGVGVVRCTTWRFFALNVSDRMWTLVAATAVRLFGGTSVLPAFYRLYGAKVGRGVFIEDCVLGTPELVHLGDGCVLEGGVLLESMVVRGDESIRFGSVRVGARTVLGVSATVDCDVEIGTECIVESLCHVPCGSRIPRKTTLKGTLARATFGDGSIQEREAGPHCRSMRIVALECLLILVANVPRLVSTLVNLAAIVLVFSHVESVAAVFLLVALGAPVVRILSSLVGGSVAVVLRWPLIRAGKKKSSELYSTRFTLRWAALQMFQAAIMPLQGFVFSRLVVRMHGGDVHLADRFAPEAMEPEGFHIDRGAFAANGVRVRSFLVDSSAMVHGGGIHVGAGSAVFDRAVLQPETHVGTGAVVGALTLIKGGTSVPPGTTVFGTPLVSDLEAASAAQLHEGNTYDKGVTGLVRQEDQAAVVKVRSLLNSSLWAVIWQDLAVLWCIWLLVGFPLVGMLMGLVYGALLLAPSTLAAAVAVLLGVPVVMACYTALQLVVAVVFKWTVIGSFHEGPEYGLGEFKWLLVNALVHAGAKPVLALVDSFAVTRWFYVAMGAKVDAGAAISPSAQALEFDLLHIGEGAWVGPGATLFCHTFQDGSLAFKRICVGKSCLVGRNAVVLPGAELGEGTRLLPLSHVLPEERFTGGRLYGGSPAEPLDWMAERAK